MKLQKDLREFIALLSTLEVRFLVVGAFAVAYHGYFRYTKDIDVFIEQSNENAQRLVEAIKRFGFADLRLTREDFLQANQVIQLGIEPNRVDVLTSLSGIKFDEAWASREHGEIDGIPVSFISREMLKRNKAASGRLQDLADLEYL